MPLGKSIFSKNAAPPAYSNSDSKEHQGVISAYSQYSSDPLWNAWLEDLRANKLQGTGEYFFDQYKSKKNTESEAAKAGGLAREAGRNAIVGRYGTLQNELTEDLWGRGFGRSGLMAEGLASLAGQERKELEGLDSAIASGQQNYVNAIASLQQQERDLDSALKDRNKNKAWQTLGTALGVGASFFNPAVGAGVQAANQALW